VIFAVVFGLSAVVFLAGYFFRGRTRVLVRASSLLLIGLSGVADLVTLLHSLQNRIQLWLAGLACSVLGTLELLRARTDGAGPG
jgi:hypothetical protein